MRDTSSEAMPRLQRLLEQQALLARVAREIGPAVQLEPVLQTVLRTMRSVVDFRGGTICLVGDDGIRIAAADPQITEDLAARRLPVGSGLAGRCVERGETIYSGDITHDPRVDQELATTGSNRGMRSYIAVPLICLGEVIGLLQMDSGKVDAFDADDLSFFEGLATQVAGAIESARRFEEVQQLEDARSMFIARVGHELRTPLTILRGLTSSIMQRPEAFDPASAEPREILGRIDAAGARLQALAEELITVSTLESGLLLVPQPVETDVAALMERVRAEAVDPESVDVTCPPGLHASLDPTLVRQILSLLLQNAIAYAGRCELVATSTGSDCSISVVDHGPGIADDRKRVVFERFSRGTHTGPGWGLGLSVVTRLADAIGAAVELTDTPGGGATFTLVLGTPG